MSSNNETVQIIVKMHRAGCFLAFFSDHSTQRYAKSRSEGTIGMQSLCSFTHNFDNGARTSIRVSERRQPLVFWESVCGSVIVLSVAIIKSKDRQVVRVNTRRKYGLMNWNDTTGVSFTCWP